MKIMATLAALIALQACEAIPSTATTAPDEPNDAHASRIARPVSVNPSPKPAEGNPAQQQTRIEELSGLWQVTGVRVAPGPVQAVTRDDPSLMGAILSISTEGLTWTERKGNSFSDTCSAPQIGPDGSIGCAEGHFGPSATHLTGSGLRLDLKWYDGAILVLSRK